MNGVSTVYVPTYCQVCRNSI